MNWPMWVLVNLVQGIRGGGTTRMLKVKLYFSLRNKKIEKGDVEDAKDEAEDEEMTVKVEFQLQPFCKR